MPDVLIVDDDAGVRQFLKAALARLGLPFRVAVNGARALEAARAKWPTVVLLDLGLPDADGWGVWDQLRREADGRPLRVVVLSGDAGSDIDSGVRARDGLGVLRKPVRPDQLAAQLSPIFTEAARSP
ncbi:MAG TPA: response regulator [Anaerolineales bacterium]|nr:response regulator [Anaerolineales bacterium]